MPNKVIAHSFFSTFDIDLFKSGHHFRLYEKFGSHITEIDGTSGVYFAVYAPAAKQVEVIGSFNSWDGSLHHLNVRWDGSGIWEGFIPGVTSGELYKYRILSNHDDIVREKSDPYARKYEMPPKTASIVWDGKHNWRDNKWMTSRAKNNHLDSPISIYEVHIGSWRKQEDGIHSLSYREMATELVSYIKDMGYTHVEFLPVMEHPFYPSWGYLCTGYFAPTSRFGDPEDLRCLIEKLHKAEIGVFLDWVPAHFPSDVYALADFDGSQLYEHPDRQKGFHPDWNSLIFNFERPEIRSFLLSSAHFWMNEYHADGLRVDAVASMLYLDYSREEGEWTPNQYGGNEYLAAADFLKELNSSIYKEFPDTQMIAEESTAYPGVTKMVDTGGLGFGLKWMMGWMNDILEYFSKDPIYRSYHHNEISRSLTYAFSENYLLPLSHDEVVHGKQALVSKMPGDEWQRFANLRLLYFWQFTHPGQKLQFMGCEIGQTSEWNVNESVAWHLLDYDPHKGMQAWVKALNTIYRKQAVLYAINYNYQGFEWIDYGDSENSVVSYMRKSEDSYLVMIMNCSPVVRETYRIGVPEKAVYAEILNSDAEVYWGSGVKNKKTIKSTDIPYHGRPYSLELTIPPLAGIILQPKKKKS